MNDRDCKGCIYSNFNGNDNGCTKWECEFIPRSEAIEAWKSLESGVKCKKCKHWTKGDDVYGICSRCTNTWQMRHDDFCSYWERRDK